MPKDFTGQVALVRAIRTAKDHGDLKPTRVDAGLCAARRTRMTRRQVRQGMLHPGKRSENRRRHPLTRPGRLQLRATRGAWATSIKRQARGGPPNLKAVASDCENSSVSGKLVHSAGTAPAWAQ